MHYYQCMKLEPFEFDGGVVDAYTAGDCWVLARTYQRMFGNAVAVMVSGDPAKHFWFHFGILMEDGRIADINGIWEREALIASWSWYCDEDVSITTLEAPADFDAYMDPEEYEWVPVYDESRDAESHAAQVRELLDHRSAVLI